jgi:hypothetical protein
MSTPAQSAAPFPTGKIVVVSIFAIAVSAALFALIWNMSRSRRALTFWGPEAMRRIQMSDRVEILPLAATSDGGASEDAETFSVAGQTLIATGRFDVTKARGLLHARHSLSNDVSYEPDDPVPLRPESWSHAIRFTDGQGSTVLLLGGQRIGDLQTKREMKLIPKVADGWQTFVERETKRPVSP